MLVRRIALALLVPIIAACTQAPSRQFTTVLRFSSDADPYPVVLTDETGEVTGIGSGPVDQPYSHSELVVRADATDPNAFIVSWLGGACDSDVTIAFKPHDSGFVLSVQSHAKGGFLAGCPALGIPRDVRVATLHPIALDTILVGGHT